MIAHWSPHLAELRADFRRFGVELPPAPVVDGRWHRGCGGHYLLHMRLPLLAMCCADGGQPQVWRNDDRLQSLSQQHIVTAAVGQYPGVAGLCRAEPSSNIGSRIDAPVADTHVQSAMPTRALAKAQAWLRTALAGGPATAVQIQSLAAQQGLSLATLRRAAAALDVSATRHGFGPGGGWTWRLPS